MRTRRWLLLLGAVIAGCLASAWWLNEPLPHGAQGDQADTLARQMEQAVDIDAWRQTGAIRFRFDLGGHEYLWDRQRELVRVRYDDTEVLMTASGSRAVGSRAGVELQGVDLRDTVDEAYRYFINDSWWLNPVGKSFDGGVTRALVHAEQGDALLVTFASGGTTPGDSYLWILDENGRPMAWKMWVSIIPLGGVRASWYGWTQLATGAWIATRHDIGPVTLSISDVQAATTLSQLVDDDPFVDFSSDHPDQEPALESSAAH